MFNNHTHGTGRGWGKFVAATKSFISKWVDGDGYVAIAVSVLESDEPINDDLAVNYEVPSWNSGAPLLQLNSQ